MSAITALLCSAPLKESHYNKPHSRDLLGGRNPGEWLPLSGWKGGSSNLKRYRAYVGFLRGRAVQGGDFWGGDWWDFNSWTWDKLRDYLDFVLGIGWFSDLGLVGSCAQELVGFQFLNWLGAGCISLALVSWPGCSFTGPFDPTDSSIYFTVLAPLTLQIATCAAQGGCTAQHYTGSVSGTR